MIRSFIAIEIPQNREIDVMLDRLRKSGARLSVPKTHGLHITLKFLGDIEESLVDKITEALNEVTINHAPFEAEMADVGGFPNLRNPRVLWIGLEEGGNMAEIAREVDLRLSELNFEREKRVFRSHITVARVKSRSGIEKALDILREYEERNFGKFSVNELKLKKSTLTPSGAIYDDLGTIPLSGKNDSDE